MLEAHIIVGLAGSRTKKNAGTYAEMSFPKAMVPGTQIFRGDWVFGYGCDEVGGALGSGQVTRSK
jgi:hypothetical protein